MSLYTINAELSELLERGFAVDEETGEVIEDIEDKLAALQMAEYDKLENIALYIKNLDAEAEAIKAEEKSLAERRKAKEGRMESLKKYLSDYLLNTNKDKFETAKVKLSFRRSEIVDVNFQEFMEWAYINNMAFLKERDPDIDKAGIKKVLKMGEEVPGTMLLTKQNLQIK